MIKDLIKAKGEEIAVLEGTDRLQYLIDLAKEAEALDNQHKVDQNKIFGCASNLWVVGKKNNGKMEYQFDADAFITKGTTKFVIDILNHQPADEITKLTKDDFKPLGIMELLTAQRQSGLSNLLDFVIRLAK
ncbi:SufE family protein [Pelagibacteraceae bacterium]|jgi:cysteine desulfuration protein SufE|nr:SufE family protein [Pelagibacteraceae bacterium]